MSGTTAPPPPPPPTSPSHTASGSEVHRGNSPSVVVAVPATPPGPALGPDAPTPSIAFAAPSPAPSHAPGPAASLAIEGEKRRLSKAPLKKRLRSPVVPLVGSLGLNYLLSQASQRTVGVKRPSPTQTHIPSVSRRSKRRKLKSEIWKDFDPVYDGKKLKEARCKHCERVFVATRESGTSQCLRHLLVCEERAKINEFLDQVKPVMTEMEV